MKWKLNFSIHKYRRPMFLRCTNAVEYILCLAFCTLALYYVSPAGIPIHRVGYWDKAGNQYFVLEEQP